MAAGNTIEQLASLLLTWRTDSKIDADELDNILVTIKNLLENNDTDSLNLAYQSGVTYDTPATAATSGLPSYSEDNDRLWKSKTDGNIGNAPPSDVGTTENTYWIEVSKSSGFFADWQPGIIGSGLILRFYNDNIYKLNVAERPFETSDIDAEITTGGIWVNITGGTGLGDLLAANNLSDLANAATARTNLAVESSTQLTTRDTNNRNRANHTGAQLASTVSDFVTTVRSVVLTGLSLVTTTAVTAADSIIVAIGKLQAQITLLKPSPTALTDGAAIAFDLNSKYFELKTLTTTNTAITLTLSNVVAGTNQILSINKNTASDVVITLAGTGLTFYGYNDADLNTTPDITLSGASGDIFDISFLARTATEIGISTGLKGN